MARFRQKLVRDGFLRCAGQPLCSSLVMWVKSGTEADEKNRGSPLGQPSLSAASGVLLSYIFGHPENNGTGLRDGETCGREGKLRLIRALTEREGWKILE